MSILASVVRRKNPALTSNEAARFLRQIYFGVRPEEITTATGRRPKDILEEQMAIPAQQSIYEMADNRGPTGFENTWDIYLNARIGATDYKWYVHPDKFKTRIAYALLDFFVMSWAISDNYTARQGISNYLDILHNNAFGSFRTMLEQITRTPEMALFLTHFRNQKGDAVSGRQPDENYAREVMQLFTIGLWELNDDGSRKKSGELDPSDPRYILNGTNDVPTYGQEDITNVARVFTGMCLENKLNQPAWFISNSSGFNGGNPSDSFNPKNGWATQLVFTSTYHESVLPKVALYGRINIPAGTNGDTSLSITLDALVNHPCTPPFFCSRMIRLLVTSNPSRAYISRVVSVFKNDGNGVRGNLGAVFKAIFLDQEARAPLEKGLISKCTDIYQHWQGTAMGSYGPVESTTNDIYGFDGELDSVTIEDTTGTLTVSTGTYTIGQAFHVRGIFDLGGSITGYTQGTNYFIGAVNSSTSIQITNSLANALTGTFALTTVPGPTTATFYNTTVGSLTATGGGAYPGTKGANYNRIGWWEHYQNSCHSRAGSVFGRFPAVYSPPNSAVAAAGQIAPEMFHYEEGGVDSLFGGLGGVWEAIRNNAMTAQDYTDLTSSPASVVNRLSILITAGTTPQAYLNSITSYVTSSAFYTQDDAQKRQTFSDIFWLLWLSPWAIIRT